MPRRPGAKSRGKGTPSSAASAAKSQAKKSTDPAPSSTAAPTVRRRREGESREMMYPPVPRYIPQPCTTATTLVSPYPTIEYPNPNPTAGHPHLHPHPSPMFLFPPPPTRSSGPGWTLSPTGKSSSMTAPPTIRCTVWPSNGRVYPSTSSRTCSARPARPSLTPSPSSPAPRPDGTAVTTSPS